MVVYGSSFFKSIQWPIRYHGGVAKSTPKVTRASSAYYLHSYKCECGANLAIVLLHTTSHLLKPILMALLTCDRRLVKRLIKPRELFVKIGNLRSIVKR